MPSATVAAEPRPGTRGKVRRARACRHAAAAAISAETDCVSIAVSSSTGQVTLFHRGVMLPLIERRVAPREPQAP